MIGKETNSSTGLNRTELILEVEEWTEYTRLPFVHLCYHVALASMQVLGDERVSVMSRYGFRIASYFRRGGNIFSDLDPHVRLVCNFTVYSLIM